MAGVGQDDGGIVIAAVHAVDHDAVESTRIQILLLDIEVGARNAVVEDTFGNLHLGILLLHRDQQLAERDESLGTDNLLEEERHEGYQGDDDNQRTEGLHQRDTSRLDSRQLRTLAQITESYQRRQQDGQRERLRHQHQSHIPEELSHNLQ